mgnify:CR=1 FL=1
MSLRTRTGGGTRLWTHDELRRKEQRKRTRFTKRLRARYRRQETARFEAMRAKEESVYAK